MSAKPKKEKKSKKEKGADPADDTYDPTILTCALHNGAVICMTRPSLPPRSLRTHSVFQTPETLH